MFYLCVLILCLFQNRSFSIREQSSKLLRPRPLHWGVHTCPPLKFTRKLSEKILVSRYGNFNEEVFFHVFFFLYPPSFLQKKPSEKWCFSKTVNIPCKGWQKNCSASRVGTTVFHLQKGSHVAVKSPSWPWGFSDGEVDSDKENANSQRHCRRCRNAAVFFFFSEDVLVLYGFILFWLGTGKTTKNNLKQNVTYLEQLEKDT